MNATLTLPALEDISAHEEEMVAIRRQIHGNPEMAVRGSPGGTRRLRRLARYSVGKAIFR